MVLFFFLSFTVSHDCLHSEMQKSGEPIGTSEIKNARKVAASRSNFRLMFDYDKVDGYDSLKCTYEGQEITWNYRTYKCDSNDLLTDKKIEVLKGTLENVKNYAVRLLKVTHYNDVIKLVNNYPHYAEIEEKEVTECDMHITVVVRPYNSTTTIAAAVYTQYYSGCKRPIQGIIMINPKYIPEGGVQDENSWNSQYFYVLFHELTHILGFSASLYNQYHPPDSNTPHSKIICSFTDTYGKDRSFLVTPHAHKYAQIHFGVDKFYGYDKNCPSGIELEDGGGSETMNNHLEGRVYNTDYMVGLFINHDGPYERVTDATAAVLLDTGNYDVNFSMIRPILWGNGETIDGLPIKGFAEDPPLTVFPSHYYDQNKSIASCGFDFKFSGKPSLINKYECVDNFVDPDEKLFCKAPIFYNPHDSAKIGAYSIFDYVPIKSPITTCPKHYVVLPGNGPCIHYYLTDREVTFTAPGGETADLNFTCNEYSEGVSYTKMYATQFLVSNYIYYCPNFERFKRSMVLYEAYFKTSPFKDSYDKYMIPEGSLNHGLTNDPELIIVPNLCTPSPNITTEYQETDDGYLGTGISKSLFIALVLCCLLFMVVAVIIIIVVLKYSKPPITSLQEEHTYEYSNE
jgi:hypothetical protein